MTTLKQLIETSQHRYCYSECSAYPPDTVDEAIMENAADYKSELLRMAHAGIKPDEGTMLARALLLFTTPDAASDADKVSGMIYVMVSHLPTERAEAIYHEISTSLARAGVVPADVMADVARVLNAEV